MEDSGEVDRQDGRPVGEIDFVGVHQPRGDAGVGERDVEPTVGVDGERGEPLHVAVDGDVSDEGHGRAARGGDLLGNAFDRGGVTVGDDQTDAVAGEAFGARFAEPGADARDDAPPHRATTVKTAPKGSAETAMTPWSVAVAGMRVVPPSSAARAVAAPGSAAGNQTSQ